MHCGQEYTLPADPPDLDLDWLCMQCRSEQQEAFRRNLPFLPGVVAVMKLRPPPLKLKTHYWRCAVVMIHRAFDKLEAGRRR